MAKLEKLAIQGIRSFGPEDSRRMEFCSPFTLIWGQNGCGKTTIIECLKYITTGEVPPGCGKGASFVHDPKIAKEPMVRGQIKLLFTSIKGERVVSSRTLEVTQKPSKLECKTLDATITHTAADGRKNSISSKCADFQAEMTSLLGVSKPILENVIFCHQEESNWPLDEGKKVKEKFDAIFNATKYIKVLDLIRKLRTEMKSKVKNMDETIDALRATKEQAERLRKECNQVEKQEDDIVTEQQQLEQDKQPLHDRLKEILNLERNLGVIEGQLNGKKHQQQSVKAVQDELKAGQNEVFDCSDSELLKMTLEFESNLEDDIRRLQTLEESFRKIERETENMKKVEAKAIQKLGQLEAGQKTHSNNVKVRNETFQALVLDHDIISFSDHKTFNCKECDTVLEEAALVIEHMTSNIKEKKKEFEIKESHVQSQMDKLRSEEAALDQNISSNSKQLENIQKNLKKTKELVSRHRSDLSSTDIDKLHKQIDDVTKRIEEETTRIDQTSIDESIQEKKRTLASAEKSLAQLKVQIGKLNREAEIRSKYEINVKSKNDLEEKIQFLKRKNSDHLSTIFGNNVPDNLRNGLEKHMADIRKQVTSISENNKRAAKSKTELEMKIENDKKSIKEKEKEITEFDDKLEDICQGGNLTTAIEKTSQQIDKLSQKEAEKTCSSVVLKNYIDKLDEEQCCPLCHRDFEQAEQAHRLKEDLEEKMTQIPDHLTQVKSTLQKLKKTHVQLLQLKPQEKRMQLAKQEVETLRARVKDNFASLEKINEEIEENNNSLDFTQSEEEIGRKLQPDVIIIEGHLKKVADLDSEITRLQGSLGDVETNLTMDSLMKDEKDHDSRIRQIRNEIEEEKNRIMEQKEKLQKLSEQKVKLSTRELELSSKQIELEKLQEEFARLETEKIRLMEEVENSKVLAAPLKSQMTEQKNKKNGITREKEQWIKNQSEKVEYLRGEQRTARDRHGSVRSYLESNAESKLEETRETLKKFQEESQEKDSKRKETQALITEVHKIITNKRERKRNLDDEQKIREKQRELISLEREINKLKEKISSFDYDSMSAEKDELMRRDSKIRHQKATLQGRLEELKKRKKELSLNLSSKGIRNAEKNYKAKLIEAKCTDVACSDLNKYYKALYTAIMKFHSEKMKTINKFIRELWRTTYKGNDIDYIEIKTDESEIKGADKRQNYNYRVVMIKNDAEMDMRGRCSAGQKVLASLIIRMSLAETFSANCGILALDEPTTNLDSENVKALSLALLNIVNRRSLQKNFQLIIITHDQEFLHALTRADSLEYFYEVSRNESGLSILRKQAVAFG